MYISIRREVLKEPWVLETGFDIVTIAKVADARGFTMDELALAILKEAVLLYRERRGRYPNHVAWSSFQSRSIERRRWYTSQLVLAGCALETHLSWRVPKNKMRLWRD